MASAILSSVYFILDDLEFLNKSSLKTSTRMKNSSPLIRKLRVLRTFLLCTIHDKDENLGSLMARIENAVCSNARKLQSYRVKSLEGSSFYVVRQISYFLRDIESLEKDINKWFFTLSDSSRRSSLAADELLRLNSSIIGNIQDYQTYRKHDDSEQALLDMLVFMRNFIRFAKLLSVESPKLEDLLSLFEAVAVNAAHLVARLLYMYEKLSKKKILVLLQKLQPCDLHVCQKYTQALISSKSSLQLNPSTRDMEDGSVTLMIEFIDSLLVFFRNILQQKPRNVVSRKDHLQALYEGLRFLRTNMKEKPKRFNQKIRHLIQEFICDAGIAIFSLYQSDAEINLPVVLRVMELIRAEVVGNRTINETHGLHDRVKNVKNKLHWTSNGEPSTSSALRPDEVEGSKCTALRPDEGEGSTSSALRPDEVVGFNDQASSIIDRLTRGSKQLRIIAIVGMAGIGKTTLATKVYNDPSITYYFHVRVRCTFSQDFNKRKVLVELLNHLDSKLSADTCLKMSDQDLVERLWRGLKGRRYLIFLDDVWDIEAWNSLQESFPQDCNGSRIVLTSRSSHIVPQTMLDEEPHFILQLTISESWELLQNKLFQGNGCPPTLYELGMKIAESCKGLPLTIIIVAGLLTNVEQSSWQRVLESLTSGIISSRDQCMNSVELSYKHLPNYLKPCFLYLGVFPEDEVVSTKSLIWLWIAEGFVQDNKSESLEEVGMNYIMDLINRSLVMVVNERSLGGVKSCRIHDFLQAFCIRKAKEEIFFHLMKGDNELPAFHDPPPNLQRLCILAEPEHLKKSRLFCLDAHSLLFFNPEMLWRKFDISFIAHIFTSLRVLHIAQINLGGEFPIAITFLQRLRYLAVQSAMNVIPASIDRLFNLEIFIMHQAWDVIFLPWNLRRLRHLSMKLAYFSFGSTSLSTKYLDYYSPLHHLESISGLSIYSLTGLEKELRMFPNIRRLKCQIYSDRNGENPSEIVTLDFFSRLESLHLRTHVEYAGLVFPENLKKLTLVGGRFPWSKILGIGKLPNLEVLKLLNEAFFGKQWDMEEGEYFLKLRFLKLRSLNIVRWIAYDGHLPCLHKLVLESCDELEEIPSCLNTIPDLRMIEVSSSNPSYIATQLEHTQNMQWEYGNSAFKILLSSRHKKVGRQRR